MGEGTSCSSDAQCDNNLSCFSNTCRPVGSTDGEHVCDGSADCGDTLRCDDDGLCVERLALDEECSRDHECELGLTCYGADEEPRTCVSAVSVCELDYYLNF